MAPEVYQRRRYNSKADVYSFSLVLWEMMALEGPYESIPGISIDDIVKGGARPDIKSSWPLEIQKLLVRSWQHTIAERPTMQDIRNILGIEIDQRNRRRRTGPTSNPRRMSLGRALKDGDKHIVGTGKITKEPSRRGSIAPRAA
eukprot:CAMPEP_0116823028 /NCGR_PEP_ID=MMETSP0418-20121206/610_1 /TAXON_ID=1158023 /ORGANISM="Astrosyne radiata, Strain 13vi08-1A" /LENGTH=143 /DNA_ID=CAMNT_0004451235 /DNA_START=1 /DNA_END=432 /DNA_ORIENTATION=-